MYHYMSSNTMMNEISNELLQKVDEKRSDIPSSRFAVRTIEGKLKDLSELEAIERSQKIVDVILEHLDNENCEHCKKLLSEVFD